MKCVVARQWSILIHHIWYGVIKPCIVCSIHLLCELCVLFDDIDFDELAVTDGPFVPDMATAEDTDYFKNDRQDTLGVFPLFKVDELQEHEFHKKALVTQKAAEELAEARRGAELQQRLVAEHGRSGSRLARLRHDDDAPARGAPRRVAHDGAAEGAAPHRRRPAPSACAPTAASRDRFCSCAFWMAKNSAKSPLYFLSKTCALQRSASHAAWGRAAAQTSMICGLDNGHDQSRPSSVAKPPAS